MHRFARLLMPLTSIAAVVALLLVLAPRDADGGERISGALASRNVYVFGQDAEISQAVEGNVQIYGGSAIVRAPIGGDLLALGGNVTFVDGGRVEGNLIYAGGTVTNSQSRVRGRTVPLSTLSGASASIAMPAVVLSLLLVWLIAALVWTAISGREIRLSSVEIRANPVHCFALGLVAMTSFILTAVLFSYLVQYLVGIPLLAALGVFAILTKIYGMIVVFHAVGSLVAAPRTRTELESRRWLRGDLVMVVIGVLVLGAVRLIPVVGPVAWSIASVFGIGVALATKFGRREPWFLAWRPLEA